ncbi:SUMF1/EgtB/PvdO family nonheme iron enzyme [Lacinutrix himadriensis]|uniref:SUMF1/EgtB/PvdO family nonheme iron enzyme n=1 Tax=Lacinutrix himadriensis TaxID=641549 RepID=UPI0006E46912|nr:SUMF1/EgtB/PvdO family nonheme iron enzyme [Lacinutrix himadriensis]
MKTRITTFIGLLFCYFSFANNITVSNISLENVNSASNYVFIEFDLSWENSWRVTGGPANWDAAWVFAKFRVNSGPWTHARINYVDGTNDEHIPAPGTTITTASDFTGVLVHRDADGSGDLNLQDMQLRWNYGLNGVEDDDIIDIKVYAIEMVYIPEDPFYVGGTSGTETNKFYQYPSTNSSYQISSEAEIAVGTTNGFLNYNVAGNSGDGLGPIPAAFPKGFNAFYIMKYEVSESQWLGFFNSLSETQKANRDVTGPDGKNSDNVVNGNTISWTGGSTNATTTAPDRSIAYLTSGDMSAYLDWSGLRPISELEYEKACRGTAFPKPGEFAWGNANIYSGSSYTITNSGASNEMISNPPQSTGNASYVTTTGSVGPVRNGIFAASAINKNREETGGSYYGVMELSGNLYERCVSVGTLRGRLFTGNHGNGIISSTGNSTASFWPNFATGDGFSYRGGGYFNGANFLRISDRFDGASLIPGSSSRIGFRAGRTAQ